MNLKSRHQVDPTFNMSSMTDIVFLLLIFFMLTSSFVTPTSLPVNVPKVNDSVITQNEKVKIIVTKDLKYYIDEEEIQFVDLRSKVREKLSKGDISKDAVVIKADEDIRLGDGLKVVGLLKELKVKVSFEVKPQD